MPYRIGKLMFPSQQAGMDAVPIAASRDKALRTAPQSARGAITVVSAQLTALSHRHRCRSPTRYGPARWHPAPISPPAPWAPAHTLRSGNSPHNIHASRFMRQHALPWPVRTSGGSRPRFLEAGGLPFHPTPS